MDWARAEALFDQTKREAEPPGRVRLAAPEGEPDVAYATITFNFCTDGFEAHLTLWTRSQEIKDRWPIVDPPGAEVLERHRAAGFDADLGKAVLVQRFVKHPHGALARFPNEKIVRRTRQAPKDAVRAVAEAEVALGPGTRECRSPDAPGEIVVAHPYDGDKLELGFFSRDAELVKNATWRSLDLGSSWRGHGDVAPLETFTWSYSNLVAPPYKFERREHRRHAPA